MSLSTNPLVDRLTRNTRPPSLRLTFWLGLAAGLASLALMLRWAAMANQNFLPAYLERPPWPWQIEPFLPLPAGLIAYLVTVRDLEAGGFQLLLLTPLRGWAVATGYLRVALFRMRVLLALGAAWIPVVIVWMFEDRLAAILYLGALLPPLLPGLLPDTLGVRVLGAVLPTLIELAGLAGWVVFSAAYGVWMALQWRRMLPGLLGMLGLPVILAGTLLPALNGDVGLFLARTVGATQAVAGAAFVLLTLALWLAARAYDERKPA